MTNVEDQDDYENLMLDYMMMTLHNAVSETIEFYGEPHFLDFDFPPMVFVMSEDLEIYGGPLLREIDGEYYAFNDLGPVADEVVELVKEESFFPSQKVLPAVMCAISKTYELGHRDMKLNTRLFTVLNNQKVLSRHEVNNDEVISSVYASLDDELMAEMYKVLNAIKERNDGN